MLFTRHSLTKLGLSKQDLDSIMSKMRKSTVMARNKKETITVVVKGTTQYKMCFSVAYDVDEAVNHLLVSKNLPEKEDYWKMVIVLLKSIKAANVE